MIEAHPRMLFLVLLAFVLAAESAALASRGMVTHPQLIRAAVIFDLCVVPAGLWWALVVRRGLARPRTIARVALAAVAVCALLFGREVRLLAVPLELALVWVAISSVRRAMQARQASDAASALRTGLAEALGSSVVVRAVATELSIFWYALFSWGRSAPAGFTAYKRAGWIAIYVAILLACVAEAIPLHFLFRRWGTLAAALSVTVHVYTALWLIGDLRALVLRPLRVEGGVLLLRIGLRWEVDVPLEAIASIERPVKSEGLRLGVLGTPNLALKLREPMEVHGPFGIRRTSDTLLLQVDEPDAFCRELGQSSSARIGENSLKPP